MTFDEMIQAVDEAETTLRIADNFCSKMAGFLVGRLHKVNGYYILRNLKRELQDFNAVTGTWKNQ